MSQVLTLHPWCPLAITGPLAFSVYAAVHIQALSRAIWQASFGDSALQKYQEWHSQGSGGHGDNLLQNCLFRQGQEQMLLCKTGLIGNIDFNSVCHMLERRQISATWNPALLKAGAWNILHKAPNLSLVLLLFVPSRLYWSYPNHLG